MPSKSSADQFCVYYIENLVNHRTYVGSSSNPKRRWKEHQKSMAMGDVSVQLRIDCERYGYLLEHFSFRILRTFSNRPSMLWFEQALIRLQWGTYDNYNTAVEVSPGNIRKVWIAWNSQTLELRKYLSGQATARDLGINLRAAKDATALPISVGMWVICTVQDGTTTADLYRCFRSMGIVDARLPYGLGLNDDEGFYRREPNWGESTGSMLMSINNHQMYPVHHEWEYRLAAKRESKIARSAIGDSNKKKAQKLALHYRQQASNVAEL